MISLCLFMLLASPVPFLLLELMAMVARMFFAMLLAMSSSS